MRLFIWIASAYSFIFSPILKGEEKPLIVGTTSGYAPYVSLNSQGDYEGFDKGQLWQARIWDLQLRS